MYHLKIININRIREGDDMDRFIAKEVKEAFDESKRVSYINDLDLIKELLMGNYDEIIDNETKKRLIQRLL